MIPWLDDARAVFPPLSRALQSPNGLLAAGGSLAPDWLLAAYRRGIFPWFNPGEPILWWSPDPRMVLAPGDVRIHRSLAKTLRRSLFSVSFDTAFAEVIAACAAPRAYAQGTWISPEMQAAYIGMHELGYAHSVEVRQGGTLVGGLYGIALGRVFFGESMFSRVSDASKVAFVHLCRHLELRGFAMIDCQMTTAHLQSLGGREIPRAEFVSRLDAFIGTDLRPGRWPATPPPLGTR